MAIPPDVQSAIDRLNGGYNNGDYNASTNPLGFSNGGHRVNLYALTADMTLVGDWFYGQIEPIALITTEVQALGAIVTEIQAVAAIDDEVALLATIQANIVTVAGISAQIVAVAANSANVNKVAAIDDAVSTVAARDAAVAVVAARDADIAVVAARDADIATVADRDADLAVIASGMPEILAAPDYAAAAQAAIRPYVFKTPTADDNPGAGAFRLNDADPALATVIYFSTVDASGASQAAFLEAMDESTTLADRGRITLTKPADAATQVTYRVTGAVVTATGYRKVPVAYIGSGGVIAVDDKLALAFERSGDKGLDGTGTGDVVGPETATEGSVAVFGATGKIIEDGGLLLSDIATTEDLDALIALAGDQTVTGLKSITRGAATDAATYLQVVPTDHGAGKPLLRVAKPNGQATRWDIALWDGVGTTGAINFIASSLTWNGLALASTALTQQWTKPQRTGITPLTSAPTITIDGNDLGGNIMSLTLEHSATMANPVNLAEGTTFSIFGQQDAVGGRTLAYSSNWLPLGSATAPAIPTAPNAPFHITGQVGPGGRIDFTVQGAGV